MSTNSSELSPGEKKRLVELLLTAGTVVGIITAFLHFPALAEIFFSVIIALFVLSSLRVYLGILVKGTAARTYVVSVYLMTLTFAFLLAGLIGALAISSATSDLWSILGAVAVYVVIAFLGYYWVFLGLGRILTKS